DGRSSKDKGLAPFTDMNEYLTKDENKNSPYGINDITHKTDDNGDVYCKDGKLKPNNTYIINGNKYTTDHNGRIISVEAKPIINPENARNNSEQTQVGGKDRRPNDQGGHIIGRDMNGDGGIGNLLPMDGTINQSDYKRMENEVKKKLENGEDVTTNTKVIYNGDSSRPDEIITTIEVDGKKDTVWKFDNNIDGSLMKEVPENGKDIVQDKANETGGEISSIKEKYDEKGNLVETTVYITYKDENGNNNKASVIIENK
ncbi:DNA/RNA non-specific endonuclease, partial [Brachyspira hampsonii]